MAILALIILIIGFAIQLLIPKARLSNIGLFGILFFVILIVGVFSASSYYSWQQYLTWNNDEVGQLFLPPHQDISYFIFYSRVRFFNPYLLSLLFSIFFLLITKWINRKYNEKFFELIEPYLLASAIFAVGHPGWIFYMVIFFFVSTLLSTADFWRLGHDDRFSLYYFWLPIAIFTILISKWLSMIPWWKVLGF